MLDVDAGTRFWIKVAVRGPELCWLWTACRRPDGYGLFRAPGAVVNAHRFAFEQEYGPIPRGLVVCHSCDNPPCCNPEHLSIGTRADNTRDRDSKQRQARGDRAGRTKIPDSDIPHILADPRARWRIAKDYGVSKGQIDLIKQGLSRARRID